MAEKAAIVTGGSSGIGLAIARMLLDEGYGVTLAARRPDKLEAAASELGSSGGEIVPVAGNMADEDTIKQVVASHRDRFGRLDVLVTTAAWVDPPGPVMTMTDSHWRKAFRTNLDSAFICIRLTSGDRARCEVTWRVIAAVATATRRIRTAPATSGTGRRRAP